MFHDAFKKELIQRFIAYLSLFCFLFTFHMPYKLFADPCPSACLANPCSCILVGEVENDYRSKVATSVATATVIALIAAAIWVAAGSSCDKGHHSSSSCCSSSSYCSSYCCDSSYYHYRHGHSHSRYSDYFSFYSDYSPFYDGTSAVGLRNKLAKIPQLVKSKDFKEPNELSGVFIIYPSCLSTSSQGSLSVFVRLPDGTTQILGNIPLSSNSRSSISYGPFTQKGTYTFGMKMNERGHFSSQFKISSVEIHLNGSTVDRHDFFVPAHFPANYEAVPYEYSLR